METPISLTSAVCSVTLTPELVLTNSSVFNLNVTHFLSSVPSKEEIILAFMQHNKERKCVKSERKCASRNHRAWWEMQF